MDEILIEDKKYVSSKRAAKLTGYAKDYVGQLCREGRVPARLVGRSWYVLESAIQDHRFGDSGDMQVTDVPQQAPDIHHIGDAPRYQAVTEQTLPSINRIEPQQHVPPTESPIADKTLHETWSAWFDKISAPESAGDDVTDAHDEPKPYQQEEQAPPRDEAVNIPIHTIYQLPPEDLLPARIEAKAPAHEPTAIRAIQAPEWPPAASKSPAVRRTTIVLAWAVAAATFSLALIGAGTFDAQTPLLAEYTFFSGIHITK